MKKNLIIPILFVFFSAGCGPQPTPAQPTEDINAIVGTMMATTLTAIAPTPVPPTNTPPPEPTAIPTQPGTLMEEFGAGFTFPDPNWLTPVEASLVKHKYEVAAVPEALRYVLQESETYLYTFNKREMPADVAIETTYLNLERSSEPALVCRVDPATQTKWYEFRIVPYENAGTIYYFERQDVYRNPYTRLAYARLTVELFRDKENRLLATCKGNKLTLNLNGQDVVSAEDTRLPGGGLIGMGGVTHSKVPVTMDFQYINVQPPQ